MGVLGDHDCESILFWVIFGLEVKSCVWKVCILEHNMVWKDWSADEERWIMGI